MPDPSVPTTNPPEASAAPEHTTPSAPAAGTVQPTDAGVLRAEPPGGEHPVDLPDLRAVDRRWSWPLFLVIGGLLFAVSSAWVFTTAPGGQPDEAEHVMRAWSVWDGQLVAPQLADGTSLITVPDNMAQTATVGCYAFKPSVDASCAYPWSQSQQLIEVHGKAARYNPIYYFVTGWAFHVTDNSVTGLYLARLASALVASLLAALGISAALLMRAGPVTVAATVIGLTPAVLSLFGALNPSSWEIAGTIAGVTALFLLMLRPRSAAAGQWAVIAAVGLSTMVVTRAASYLWLAVFLVFAVATGFGRLRAVLAVRSARWSALAVVLALGWSLLWQRIAGTGAFDLDTQGRTYREGIEVVFRESGFWWDRMIGWLGWADVAPTTFSLWVTLMSFGAVLLLGLAVTARWRMAILLAMVAAAVLVPLAGAVWLYPTLGNVWQGRYNIPICLMPLLLAAMLVDLDDGVDAVVRHRLRVLLLLGWLVVGLSMLFYNLQRFAIGADHGYGYLWYDTPWAPPGGLLLWLAVGGIGYLGVTAAVLLASRRARAGSVQPVSVAVAGSAAGPA